MSRRQKIKHMTSDELKTKLYAHFQKTGSLDHLRTQLRGQLVSELFKVAEPIDFDKFPNASDFEKCLLPLQVCNWLVYDHLSRQDYQYSVSTFVAEAQLPYPEKFLTAGDILGLLGFSHSTREFESISKLYTENNELGYLHSLLLAILKALFNIPNKDLMLNQDHDKASEMHNSSKKKSICDEEEINHSLIENKVRNLHDTSFSGEFSKTKEFTLNQSFSSNNDMQATDLSFHEQLQSVKKESEREVQKLRHKLLNELENLHSQEHKLHLEMEFTKSELKREQNKLLKEKEILKEKEVILEKEITNKYEMKMRDVESNFASQLHFKDKELQSLKVKLMEKDQKLAHVEIELSGEKDNYNLMKQELEDLKHMFKIIQDKYSSVLDENTNLLKKFESMSDYAILKEELATKSNEVTRLQNEIKDIHLRSETERKKYVETVRNLEEKLNMKEPQLIQTRKELEQVRNTLISEEVIWNKEKKRLELELGEFKDLYKTVIQRMEDQKDDIQDLHKTIHILNYKLTNNVINVTRSESSIRSFKNFQTNVETSQKSKPENLFSKKSMFLQQQPSEKYNDSSLKFLSDAKNRFGKLKQEEDAVQEKYSYIFSALPECNKQLESDSVNFNVSVPKSSIGDYSFIPLSKSAPVNSDFSYNNWSKSRVSSYIKNPYSLNDVKRMVSHSLFPYKTGNRTDFQIGLSNLDAFPKESSILIDRPKDIWKKSETYSEHSEDQYVSSRPKDTSISNIHGNEFHGRLSSDLQTVNSKDKEICQDYETVINPESSTNITGHFQQRSEVAKKSAQNDLLERITTIPSNINTNMPSKRLETVPGSQDLNDQNTALTSEDPESISLQTSQEMHKVSLATSENRTEASSSLFINLDAAWKQMSSVPASSSYRQSAFITEESPTKKANVSSVSSSLSPINKKQDMFVSGMQQLVTEEGKHDSSKGQAVIASTENINRATEAALGITTETKDGFEKKSELSTQKQSVDPFNDKIDNVDTEIPKDSEKSAEKIASADSLSELSEVHFSCGSEGEQQKEDSDAW